MKNIKFLYKNWFTYLISLIVLVISLLISYYSQNEVFENITKIPGIMALVLVLYKSWKDEQLQNKQQDFILGTASHMAEVAYNKHVKFSEEYVNRIQRGFQELLRDGASPKVMNIGGDLVRIRQKHSAWLTSELENKLKPFEQVLIEIGTNEHYLLITAREGMNDNKRKVIDKIYKSLGLVLGNEKPSNDDEAELRIDRAIDKIRDILGIKALTKLRFKATDLALKRLDD